MSSFSPPACFEILGASHTYQWRRIARFQYARGHDSESAKIPKTFDTFSIFRMLKIGFKIELIEGPRYFWDFDARDSSGSWDQYHESRGITILYALRRRFVIHLTPVSLGRNLTKLYPIDFLPAFLRINLALSYKSVKADI